jgi:hypothetical protein
MTRIKKTPRVVIDSMLEQGMIQSPKQAWRIGKGIYDCGIALDLGWKNEGSMVNIPVTHLTPNPTDKQTPAA